MSTFGHTTPLSAATLASLSASGWMPTLLACAAVILIGACLLCAARECAE